jgi:hypothetical protein
MEISPGTFTFEGLAIISPRPRLGPGWATVWVVHMAGEHRPCLFTRLITFVSRLIAFASGPPQPQRRRLPIIQGPPWQGLCQGAAWGGWADSRRGHQRAQGGQGVGGRGRVGLCQKWLHFSYTLSNLNRLCSF